MYRGANVSSQETFRGTLNRKVESNPGLAKAAAELVRKVWSTSERLCLTIYTGTDPVLVLLLSVTNMRVVVI